MKAGPNSSRQNGLRLLALALSLVMANCCIAAPWTTNAPMTLARRAHTASLLQDGKILVAGGDTGFITTSAELYDPTTGTWQATASMTNAHAFHTATRLPNGKVLVAGGPGIAAAELYDPATHSWTNTGSMNSVRYQHTATLLADGRVLVAGGIDNAGDSLASCEVYNPTNGIWTLVGSMNSTRWSHTATRLANGQVLAAGGGIVHPSSLIIPLSSAEVFDPVTGNWTNTASFVGARFDHAATLLPNGKVLIAGGFDGSSISSSELYDPTSGTWTNGGAMNVARDTPTMTLLSNGKLLVTGGYSDGNYVSSTELYDASLVAWTNSGAMSSGRWQQTATLLTNGKVLVAGGYDGTSLVASTDLYDPTSGSGPTPPILTGITTNGSFRLFFTNNVGSSFEVLATTNLLLHISNWSSLGNVLEISPGQFQFTDSQATNLPQRFYRVRSP